MIELKDIERLAELARIKMSTKEMEAMRKDMDSILGYVGQIQEVAANADSEPKAGILRNVMRGDDHPHEPGIHSEVLLAEAPSRNGQYFKVKKVLGGSDVA